MRITPKGLAAAIMVAGLITGAAACGPSNSPAASSSHVAADKARASAAATSSQAQAAKADLKKDAAQCQPKGTTSLAWLTELLAHQSTRDALYNCAGVSKSQRPATGKCVLAAAEKAIGSGGSKAARETAGINDLNGCVK